MACWVIRRTRAVLCRVSAFVLLMSVFSAMSLGQQSAGISYYETNDELVVVHPNYQLHLSRYGFGLTLLRNRQIVLQSAQRHDSQSNLSFKLNGAVYNPTSLKSYSWANDALQLIYRTDLDGATARVELTLAPDSIKVRTWALKSGVDLIPSFRYRISPSGMWYGGGFQGWSSPQIFPLNDAHIDARWFLAEGNTQGTPVWYNTAGTAIWFLNALDFRYSFNAMSGNKADGMLFVEAPAASELDYEILIEKDVRAIVQRTAKQIGYPQQTPPEDYFRDPIFTTWVEYKAEVSQQKVMEFARAIRDAKIPAGIIEIDDKWESHYGDMQFDSSKFPDPKVMVDELHQMGFKVTLWVHPFVNIDSEGYAQLSAAGDLVGDRSGHAGRIEWWDGVASVWDFTKPEAAAKYRARLAELQSKYGFDGFKFDGGDANLVPRDLKTHTGITAAEYADVYNREAAAHFTYNEARVGIYSQPLGIVQRLIDKQSIWGKENGLQAIIPEALNTSMRGFAYVMPDMVGGNQYNNDKIDKELMIRWAQASALMPLLQFSVGPWHFDDETVRLCREAAELHVKFSPYIYQLAKAASSSGEPIMRSLWYQVPADPNTYQISDEFMLGGDVVVAPVVIQGAIARDIYLPEGQWRDLRTGRSVESGWHRGYAAALDVLPVFVRADSRVAHELGIK